MPRQGTQVATWILMCLVLVLIWIVTILVIRALIGGRPANQLLDPGPPRAKLNGVIGRRIRGSLTAPSPQPNGIRIRVADGESDSGTQTGEVNERA